MSESDNPNDRLARAPYGSYKKLLPIIRKLVVSYGVSTRAVAEIFGLRRNTVTARLGEVGAFEERDARDRDLAQQALVDLILRGELDEAEYAHRLDAEWRRELQELKKAAETP